MSTEACLGKKRVEDEKTFCCICLLSNLLVIIKEWCLRLERVTNLNLEEIHGWGKTPFLKALGASATLL